MDPAKRTLLKVVAAPEERAATNDAGRKPDGTAAGTALRSSSRSARGRWKRSMSEQPLAAERLAKLAMVASLAAFTGLVAADNLLDYGTNFAFVQHVLSMDTVFPDNTLRWRAITQPALWHVAYGAIIAAEGAAFVCLAIGTLAMLRTLRAGAAAFERAKRFTVIGLTLVFLIWFTGFMVVGGEWFSMWQSKIWNGQQAAFRFYLTGLAVLIFVMQPERDRA